MTTDSKKVYLKETKMFTELVVGGEKYAETFSTSSEDVTDNPSASDIMHDDDCEDFLQDN